MQGEENIRALGTAGDVIALPYGPATPPPVIALHGPQQAGDSGAQQHVTENRSYYKDDDARVTEYLNSPFKVVKREQISQYFTEVAQIISTELIEKNIEAGLVFM